MSKCENCGAEAGSHKLCIKCQMQKDTALDISSKIVVGDAKLTITRKDGTKEVR